MDVAILPDFAGFERANKAGNVVWDEGGVGHFD